MGFRPTICVSVVASVKGSCKGSISPAAQKKKIQLLTPEKLVEEMMDWKGMTFFSPKKVHMYIHIMYIYILYILYIFIYFTGL